LIKNKTLDQLLNPPVAGVSDVLLYVIIGAVIGALLTAVLFLGKVIVI
jgi:hypothetical protein